MGQLCDSGCQILFDATSVRVRHNNDQVVLVGKRTPNTGLLHLNLVPPPRPVFLPAEPSTTTAHCSHAAAIGSASTPADLVAFSHAALFSPTLLDNPQILARLWLDRSYLSYFPGLTSKLAVIHLRRVYIVY